MRRSGRRNMNILPRYLGGHAFQQDSIQKIGMSYSKKIINGRCQINGRGFHRWCFVDKRSMKYRPSTLQGREDYMVNNLYLADREMDKMFNEDR